jgi:hypothetical protein
MNIDAICLGLPPVSSWSFIHQFPFSEQYCIPRHEVPPLRPTVSIHSDVLERIAERVGRIVDDQRADFTRDMVVRAQMIACYPEKADAMVPHLENTPHLTPFRAAFAVELFRRHLDLHVQYLATHTFHRYVYLMRQLLIVVVCDDS